MSWNWTKKHFRFQIPLQTPLKLAIEREEWAMQKWLPSCLVPQQYVSQFQTFFISSTSGENFKKSSPTYFRIPRFVEQNILAWNNESSAYSQVERIVVGYNLSKKEVTLNRIGVNKNFISDYTCIVMYLCNRVAKVNSYLCRQIWN